MQVLGNFPRRVQAPGLLKACHGLVQFSQRRQRAAETVVSHRISGHQRKRPSVASHGAGEVVSPMQTRAEIKVGLGKVGPAGDCLPVARFGAVQASLPLHKRAKVIVGVRMSRREAQDLLQAGDCLIRLSQAMIRAGQKIERVDVDRICLKHLAVKCLGLNQLACVMVGLCPGKSFSDRRHDKSSEFE